MWEHSKPLQDILITFTYTDTLTDTHKHLLHKHTQTRKNTHTQIARIYKTKNGEVRSLNGFLSELWLDTFKQNSEKECENKIFKNHGRPYLNKKLRQNR